MTENSFYWSGTTADSPGDAGPYADSTMWQNFAQIAISGNAESDSDLYNLGVFYSVANKLEVTLDGVNLDVDTGAGLVDGAYYENDASVDITVDAAAADDERIDYIVLRKCYEGSTYNPGGNVPAVDEQEVRITVIKGTEVTPPAVPSAPSLTQDTSRTTYWDVPLATVEVDDTGAISVTDAREYADAETKYLWAPVLGGYDIDGVAAVTAGGTGADTRWGVVMLDAHDTKVIGSFVVPNNFISDMSAYAVTFSAAGDLVIDETETGVYYGACGESASANYINLGAGLTTQSVSGFVRSCIAELSMTSVEAGDIASIEFERQGSAGTDTLANVGFEGWLIEYFGWKK